jgi:hypothetical protein
MIIFRMPTTYAFSEFGFNILLQVTFATLIKQLIKQLMNKLMIKIKNLFSLFNNTFG